jgi:hypothetical protein
VNGGFGVSGGTQLNSCNIATTLLFNAPTLNDWAVYRNAPQRIFQWAGNVTDVYHETQGTRYWNFNGVVMSLGFQGNLVIAGAAVKPGGGPWDAPSDDRLKRNARPYAAGLAQIMALEPIAYEYNGQGGTRADGMTYFGVSAQKTRAVMPEMVFEQKLGTKDGSLDPRLLPGQLATNLGPLTLALVNCCKELAARVAVLEARCPG